ncbi:MAG TPA: DUF1992 domain-containing protein [Leptolinea sp.]
MDVLKIIAENKIETALAEGVFDNLIGKGKPLALKSVQPAGDEHCMANYLLKNNGFLPAWLEERQTLQKEIAACQGEIKTTGKTVRENQETILLLNRKISGYNLRVPIDAMQLLMVSEVST